MADVGIEALELYDVPKVAKLTRLSTATIWRLIRSGELESVKVGSRRLVAPEAIIAWKRRLAEQAASAAS